MSVKVYFVRHGETDFNKGMQVLGTTNIPLNRTGIEQVKELRDRLTNVKFDAVYTSPLFRAVQTATILIENQGPANMYFSPSLSERNFGQYEGRSDITKKIMNDIWRVDSKYVIKDGESYQDMIDRLYPFLDEICEKHDGQTILLVAHAGIGRLIQQYFIGTPPDGNLLSFPPIHNASCFIFKK